MIQKKVPLIVTLICLAASTLVASNYVSNDLYTYTHNGPGTKYKILGVVHAGEKITVLHRDKKTGYSQIKDPKGHKVWMESKHISNKLGLKKQLENLRTTQKTKNEEIISLKENLTSKDNQILALKETNLELTTKLEKLQELNISLTKKVDNKKNEQLMEWFSYGGMVAGIGLLFGLILPSLIPSRKKQTRW
ncbi:TIGR04211 family SH3 domain-containing protein [Arcobacteraceae bacterium]|nr:TIGR04211 family SH3 domain-containing protein [Arcobacteraceae bacterium]